MLERPSARRMDGIPAMEKASFAVSQPAGQTDRQQAIFRGIRWVV
jgi:hypothetical protein